MSVTKVGRPNRREILDRTSKKRVFPSWCQGCAEVEFLVFASPSRLKGILPRLQFLNPVAFDGLSRKSKCRSEVESGVDKVECLG